MKIRAYFAIARPSQWLKNLMVFFPPFLSGSLFHSGVFLRGVLPFAAFCLASSATYMVNDVMDAKLDSFHPRKCFRPLPAGDVTRTSVIALAFMLAMSSLLLAWIVKGFFLFYLALYLVISVAYSLKFKHQPIIDIFCIAFGFVLRLYGGGAAFGVLISDWLFLTVFLLAVFLGFGKRVSEKLQLGKAAGNHRQTLDVYPDGFLESAMYLSGASVLVTYSLYAIATPLMVYTVPLCLFGLLRYLLLVKTGSDGDPTSALIKDGSLLLTGVMWVALVGLAVYR
jgi:4-hydroxybenzoate polyprenyltransferase